MNNQVLILRPVFCLFQNSRLAAAKLALSQEPLNVEMFDGKKRKLQCPYCPRVASNFSEHLRTVHSNEHDVREAYQHPKDSVDRKRIIAKLRADGRLKKNNAAIADAATGGKTAILEVARRPNAKFLKGTCLVYALCPKCRNPMRSTLISDHMKRCKSQNTVTNSSLLPIQQARAAEPVAITAKPIIEALVLSTLNPGPEKDIILKDELLIELCNKREGILSMGKHRAIEINRACLALARFLIFYQGKDPSVKFFSDIVSNPRNVKNVIEAIKEFTGFCSRESSFLYPDRAKGLGTMIPEVTGYLLSISIQRGSKAKCTKLRDFQEAFNIEYKSNFGSKARIGLRDDWWK